MGAFRLGQGSRIKLSTSGPIHLDGNVWPGTGAEELEVEAGVQKLRVMV